MTKKEIAAEIVAIIGGDAEQLAKKSAKELKLQLQQLQADKKPSEEAKETNNETDENLSEDVSLKDIIIKNGKVNFVYSDGFTEEVKFKKDKRELIYSIIRKAQFQINVASKPEPQKDKIQSIHNLTYTKICRIALDLDTISNEPAKALFIDKTVAELLQHPAVDVIALKSIADAYCVTEKLNRL